MNQKNPKESYTTIRRLKKTCLLASLAMVLCGLLLGGAGLIAGRSHPEALEETGAHNWYRTFSISEDGFWFGVDFTKDGAFQLVNFGDR